MSIMAHAVVVQAEAVECTQDAPITVPGTVVQAVSHEVVFLQAPAAAAQTQPRAEDSSGIHNHGPPNPIYRKGGREKLRERYHTGSPHTEHRFFAPLLDGAMSESDFDRAISLLHADATDPLAAYYPTDNSAYQLDRPSSGMPTSLDLDVEGRVDMLKKVAANNRACMFLCVPCFCVGACALIGCCANDSKAPYETGETEETGSLRTAARAHSLTLNDSCIVYGRAAHTTKQIKNYVAFDQYGHKYPSSAWTPMPVAPGALTLPLRHAELELVRKDSIHIDKGDFWCQSDQCCEYKDDTRVLVLRAGEAVKVVVACVELGPKADANGFVARFYKAKAAAPPESDAQAAAYAEWFTSRLLMSGTMAGAGVRGQAGPGIGSSTAPFVKTMERMPVGMEKRDWSMNTIPRMGHVSVAKSGGRMWTPHQSAQVRYLNAGDTMLGINGVMHGGTAGHEWIDTAMRAADPSSGSITLRSTMPYFQPNSLVTLGPLPPQSVAGLPLGPSRPPTLTADDVSVGLERGDVIVQAAA